MKDNIKIILYIIMGLNITGILALILYYLLS